MMKNNPSIKECLPRCIVLHYIDGKVYDNGQLLLYHDDYYSLRKLQLTSEELEAINNKKEEWETYAAKITGDNYE